MTMINLTIDNKKVQVEQKTNLIDAAKQAGIKIPHFCYHPGLSTDGNCRMCLVEVEKSPKLVIACKTPVAEGMVVKTNAELVKKAQASVMEFLLVNHPLDCPTCDQAGECKLQDYYMDYDLKPSRYQEAKVEKRKMTDLGGGIILDEERCVVCRRCVRFCQEIAKKDELSVQMRGNHSVVATFPGKDLSNPYAGCIADVCPVGALTSIDFRYKKRVWYLTKTSSICPGCSRGCNITVQHEKNTVYRLKPRHNPSINNYWICDYGRNDYKFINENRRLVPCCRQAGNVVELQYDAAMAYFRKLLKEGDPLKTVFIANAGESNEAIDIFVGFAKGKYSQDFVYYSKNDPDSPYSDDILITKDKNPNLAHVNKLGLRPVDDIPESVQTVVIQRNLSEKDHGIIMKRGLKVLTLFSTNHTKIDELAEIILPIPSFAEQAGHFTNLDGVVQKFEKAFESRGEAREIQEYLS